MFYRHTLDLIHTESMYSSSGSTASHTLRSRKASNVGEMCSAGVKYPHTI